MNTSTELTSRLLKALGCPDRTRSFTLHASVYEALAVNKFWTEFVRISDKTCPRLERARLCGELVDGPHNMQGGGELSESDGD